MNNLQTITLDVHQALEIAGYKLLDPSNFNTFLDDSENLNEESNPLSLFNIENTSNSIYHYYGSCKKGEVVDQKNKLLGKSNLYIADLSTLNAAWPGSTSYVALLTGYHTATMNERTFFSFSIEGHVAKIPIEGSFLGLISSEGEKFSIYNNELNLDEIIGQKKLFTIRKLADIATIHMWGTPIEIVEINEI